MLLVALVFTVGTMLTGVGPDRPRRELPSQFAHSIVPIVIGYVIAHYLTYLLEVGEQTFVYMSDPFSNGSNWFGTANWEVSYSSPTTRPRWRRSRCWRSSWVTWSA